MEDFVICPNCGKKNDKGDMFCGNCGTRLDAQAKPAQRPAAANNAVKPAGMAAAANPGVAAKPVAVNPNAQARPAANPNAGQNVAFSQNAPAGQNGEAGKGAATASLVLGILAVVCWFFGYSSILSVIFGIIGVALAGKSKNDGFEGGTRTAGFILSLIGLIGGALVLVACVACVGSLGILGASL